jgi:5-methylcytosine-specific restriction endonuclease McrA
MSTRYMKRKNISSGKDKCLYCQRNLHVNESGDEMMHPETFTFDHVIEKCLGGSNKAFNLIPCCNACNGKRDTLQLTAFGFFLWRFKNPISGHKRSLKELEIIKEGDWCWL